MKSRTHAELTRAVFLRELPPAFASYAEDCASNASLPDEQEDIVVGRFGTKVAGHVTGALTHFTVPTAGGKFRGYSWRSDRSLWHCIRKFDPRVGDVACRPGPWVRVVGKEDAELHPLAMIIRSLNGKATLDADNFTFPTGAAMASWLWQTTRHLVICGEPSPLVVGSVCHFIQDAAVAHHARGWLSKGHSGFEARIQREFERTDPDDLLLQAAVLIDPDFGPRTPRGIVESAAMMAGRLLDNAHPERQTLILAAAWTRAFVRRCVMPSM